MSICKICSNSYNNEHYTIKEMMFGMGDTFDYFLCSKCSCFQIQDIPDNINKFYGSDYYSFKVNRSFIKKLSNYIAVLRDKSAILNDGIIGKLLSLFIPAREVFKFISYLEGIDQNSRILDVGSGTGFHVNRLAAMGFKDVRAIDPYIKEDIFTENKVRIFKKYLADFEENGFSLITLHHTFEHLSNPKETLELIQKKLIIGGYCVIRIPVFPNEAWDMYKENWFQIDAPRHFFIHSKASLAILCDQTGFKINKIIYDSNAAQYFISEQYSRGVPLIRQKPISISEKVKYEKMSKLANQREMGDQAVIILQSII